MRIQVKVDKTLWERDSAIHSLACLHTYSKEKQWTWWNFEPLCNQSGSLNQLSFRQSHRFQHCPIVIHLLLSSRTNCSVGSVRKTTFFSFRKKTLLTSTKTSSFIGQSRDQCISVVSTLKLFLDYELLVMFSLCCMSLASGSTRRCLMLYMSDWDEPRDYMRPSIKAKNVFLWVHVDGD